MENLREIMNLIDIHADTMPQGDYLGSTGSLRVWTSQVQ